MALTSVLLTGLLIWVFGCLLFWRLIVGFACFVGYCFSGFVLECF